MEKFSSALIRLYLHKQKFLFLPPDALLFAAFRAALNYALLHTGKPDLEPAALIGRMTKYSAGSGGI